MLCGTADLAQLERDAPRLDGFDTEPAQLEGVELLQVLYEIERTESDALLPPALHPTVPPVVRLAVYRVAESPWGPFQLAQARIECRSSLRHRGYLLGGLIDNPTAESDLTRRWGFRLRPGELRLERGYYETRAMALYEGSVALDVKLRDPVPLRPEDLQFIASMHPASTPRGLRLVQCEPTHEVTRVERGKPELVAFSARAFGDARVKPAHPISAVLCLGRITLPRLRFVCRADVPAFEGTETV